MSAQLLVGMPATPPANMDIMRSFITANVHARAHMAFAYVSLAGLEAAIVPLEVLPEHRQMRKRWVVGLHNGITEPAALEQIYTSPNTRARVYLPPGKLTYKSLLDRRKLHAKSVCLYAPGQALFVCSSANMTSAAVGPDCTNFEAGIAVSLGRQPAASLAAEHRRWFGALWQHSVPLTDSFIEDYAVLRRKALAQNPFLLTQVDDHPESTIGDRECLWIEAGSMSGGDRNQVEFGPLLARFFGQLQRASVLKRLRWGQVERADRPLSHKITKWGTDIWRFSLITSNQGGPSYQGQIVHFRRCTDGDGEYFEVEVAAPGSTRAARWRNLADRSGTRAMTGLGRSGARQYGVY